MHDFTMRFTTAHNIYIHLVSLLARNTDVYDIYTVVKYELNSLYQFEL